MLSALLASLPCRAQIPAFPDAEGGGAEAIGGRGGSIIEVTNLNNAGIGSLRAACEALGPRIVVFRVSGIIDLTDLIYISNPHLTIAGQTAPGGGITIRGLQNPGNRGTLLYIATNNVMVRYLRLRHGYNDSLLNLNGKNIVLEDGAENIMIDHCSLSWAQDKNFAAWGYNAARPLRNVTVQYSIISEPIRDEFGNATGMIMGGGGDAIARAQTNLDVHHNFFGSNRHRDPLFKGYSGRIINNIVYHYLNYGVGWEGGAQLDIIGNLFKDGPNVSSNKEIAYRDDPDHAVIGTPSLFIEGNRGPNNANPLNNNWVMVEKRTTWATPGTTLDNSLRRTTRLAEVRYPISVQNVDILENTLLPSVGASKRLDSAGKWISNRDAVDVRVISDFNNRSGVFLTSGMNGEAQVGGYPTIAAGIPYPDVDLDGMSDPWETTWFGNTTSKNGKADADSDGYTDVEEFLNGSIPVTTKPVEVWRYDQFGTIVSSGQGADTADPDGDGLDNLQEYVLGGNPIVADSAAFAPAMSWENGVLKLTFNRSRSEVTYIVQGNNTLTGTWTDLATNPGTVGKSVTFTDTVSQTAAAKRFLRLRAIVP